MFRRGKKRNFRKFKKESTQISNWNLRKKENLNIKSK